jgi:predicted AlkP superfamily pyrophosphatase or phosphodiesterase
VKSKRATSAAVIAMAVGFGWLGCAGAPPRGAAEPATKAAAQANATGQAKGRVVVSIVVDQLAGWIAAERFGELPADGGFARLRREGTYARDVRYAHASTDTAPGHAALYTGAVPRVSGIYGNEIPDAAGEKISILVDETTHLVAGEPTTKPGSSIRALKIDTVADRFRAAHPDALVVSLSLKDRGAIFGGGKAPTASVWWDKKLGFVTSTAFGTALPSFVPKVAFPKRWELSDATWVAKHARTADAQAGEGDLSGLGTTFPHVVNDGNAFRATPMADETLVAMGEAAIANAAGKPTLLALSLSANDYVGHTFGPDSWEAWDELRRLDATLGGLFAWLDRTFGADGWDAILSADHGVTTMPEAANDTTRPWCAPGAPKDPWQRACGPVKRLLPKELGVLDPYAYVKPGEDRAALGARLAGVPGITHVYETRAIAAQCPPESDESVDALVCRAYVPGHGDFYLVLAPGDFFDPDVVVGKGTSHGSPYLFDRSVPLLVRAPGRAAAGRTVAEPVSFRAFARTLASLLGVDPADPEAARAVDFTKSR